MASHCVGSIRSILSNDKIEITALIKLQTDSKTDKIIQKHKVPRIECDKSMFYSLKSSSL